MELDLKPIEKISKAVVDLYRSELADNGINASGKLSRTAQSIVEFNGRHLLVYLELEDYWKFVENGRRAGKMPPINAILNWIKVKPIVPRAINGRIPDTRQLAFLIARKIGNEGYKGRHPIENITKGSALNSVIEQIKNEIAKQITDSLDLGLK